MAAGEEWNAALELLIATNGGEAYKKRVLEMFPSVRQRFGFGGWTAVRALPYMDADFKKQLEEAVKTYVAQLDKDLATTPFGVPPSLRQLGRLGSRGRPRRPDVLPAQGISGDRGHGLHAARRQLHAGHASGIEHVVRFLGRDSPRS